MHALIGWLKPIARDKLFAFALCYACAADDFAAPLKDNPTSPFVRNGLLFPRRDRFAARALPCAVSRQGAILMRVMPPVPSRGDGSGRAAKEPVPAPCMRGGLR